MTPVYLQARSIFNTHDSCCENSKRHLLLSVSRISDRSCRVLEHGRSSHCWEAAVDLSQGTQKNPQHPWNRVNCQMNHFQIWLGFLWGGVGVTHFNFQTEFVWWVSHYLRSSWDVVECLLIFQSIILLECLVMFEPRAQSWKGLPSLSLMLGVGDTKALYLHFQLITPPQIKWVFP